MKASLSYFCAGCSFAAGILSILISHPYWAAFNFAVAALNLVIANYTQRHP